MLFVLQSKRHNIGFNRNIYCERIETIYEHIEKTPVPTSSAKRVFFATLHGSEGSIAPQLRRSDGLSPLPNALDKGRSERGPPATVPGISSRMFLYFVVCVYIC